MDAIRILEHFIEEDKPRFLNSYYILRSTTKLGHAKTVLLMTESIIHYLFCNYREAIPNAEQFMEATKCLNRKIINELKKEKSKNKMTYSVIDKTVVINDCGNKIGPFDEESLKKSIELVKQNKEQYSTKEAWSHDLKMRQEALRFLLRRKKEKENE